MQLTCPSCDVFNTCDIDFNCENNGVDTNIVWVSNNGRFECNDQQCCPWSSPDDMIKPITSSPTIDTDAPSKAPSESPTDSSSPTKSPSSNPTLPSTPPTTAKPTKEPSEAYIAGDAFPGYTLFVRGFNIWKVETSGNAILDLNYYSTNIGASGYTTEGSTCSLSSLEFDSSFSSYSSYAESDELSISAGYGAGKGEAGGSYSRSRTETREQAASAQTYIYTLDLECTKARVSLQSYNEIYWNSFFINSLRLLPNAFDSSDNMEDYEDFWNAFGTHVIQSGKLGGSIRGAITVDACSVEESYSSSESYEVCLNAAYKGAEAEGCYGESESQASGTSISNSISNKRIVMKGGDTATFTETFNSFEDKTNDFQSWINTLDDNPDIVGGNLDEIHDALKDAILLGGHKLNVASSEPLSDEEWQTKLSALKEAFEYQVGVIVEEDTIFDAATCTLNCGEGNLDLEECVCNSCEEISTCCGYEGNNASQIYIKYAHIIFVIAVFVLFDFIRV